MWYPNDNHFLRGGEGRMNSRDVVFSNNRLSQLPVAIFGIIHDVASNGIAMPIFNNTVVRQAK